MKHILFLCNFARSIWSVIYIGSILCPPRNLATIFGNCRNGVDDRFKLIISVGAFVVIWSLSLCRNDQIFNDKSSSLLQVIQRCTTTLRSWSYLECMEHRDLFMQDFEIEDYLAARILRLKIIIIRPRHK
jgi:hypothetical protein